MRQRLTSKIAYAKHVRESNISLEKNIRISAKVKSRVAFSLIQKTTV